MYSPDGQFQWNGSTWVPVQQAAPPPPPPPIAPPVPPAAPPYAPPPGYPPMPPGAAPVQQAAPFAPPFGAAPMGGNSDMSFGEVAWNSGIPLGTGYIIRIDDIEAGTSQNNNDKLVFTGVTLQPNGNIAAGFKAVWSYTLSEKAVGKLGRDMVALGLTNKRYPRDKNALAQALLAELRGVVVIADSTESKGSDLPNTSIVGRYTVGAQQPTPTAQSPFPPTAPAPAAAPPSVSFPSGPPPPSTPTATVPPTAPPPGGFANV